MNYVIRAHAALQKAGITLTPENGPSFLFVKHDNRCRIYRGKTCNCKYDLEIHIGGKLYLLDKRGKLVEKTRH